MRIATATCRTHLAPTIIGLNPAFDPGFWVVTRIATRVKVPCHECDARAQFVCYLENL